MKISCSLFIAFMSLFLPSRAWSTLDTQVMESIVEDCRARYVKGTQVDATQCMIEQAHRRFQDPRDPEVVIMNLLLVYRLALAQRVDEGQLSKEEANQLLQSAETLTQRILIEEEMVARLRNEESYRKQLLQEATAHPRATLGALLQAIGAIKESNTSP